MSVIFVLSVKIMCYVDKGEDSERFILGVKSKGVLKDLKINMNDILM